MKVFVAGATGVVGRPLVAKLIAAGHQVHGMTRSEARTETVAELGAEPVVADALDAGAVAAAVARAEPEVIVHQLTAIGDLDLRRFDRDFAPTNRLRTEGTDHLLAAARSAGVSRFVAQGVAAFGAYARRGGGPVKSEDDPLESSPPREMRETMAAIRHLDGAVSQAEGIEGIVLRYGVFYGPGTALAPGGQQYEMVRGRKFPIVGDGAGVWSFIHVEDAADAALAAVERGEPGAYNVVDDEPAAASEWLPAFAERIGAKRPMRVPRFVGRLFAGETGVAMLTEIRGASNGKAKRDLGWTPAHPSWREALGEG